MFGEYAAIYDSDQAVGATVKDFTVFVDGVEVVEAEGPVEALLMWLICQFVFSLKYKGAKITGQFLAYYVFAVEDVEVKDKEAKKVIEGLRSAMR